MEWRGWEKKWVFMRTRTGKVYSGTVMKVDCDHLPIIWLILKDKFGKTIHFCTSEIVEIKEEKCDDKYIKK